MRVDVLASAGPFRERKDFKATHGLLQDLNRRTDGKNGTDLLNNLAEDKGTLTIPIKATTNTKLIKIEDLK